MPLNFFKKLNKNPSISYTKIIDICQPVNFHFLNCLGVNVYKPAATFYFSQKISECCYGAFHRKKMDFPCRGGTFSFTFGLSIKPLRTGSTLFHFFVNHSMPPSIHLSIHGLWKNTHTPQVLGLQSYV